MQGFGRLMAVAACLAGGQALAQDASQTGTLNCETAETQVDLNACAKMDFDEADSDLNDAYAAAVARMQALDAGAAAGDQGAVAALKAAQRTWITFRDQACTTEGWTVHGGSMEPMVVLECKARITTSRSDDLWSLATPPDANP